MSITNDENFLTLLILHLIRSTTVAEIAVSVLSPDDFNQVGERSFRILWDIAKKWFMSNGKTIPRAYLEIELKQRMATTFGEFTAEDTRDICDLVDLIYSASEDILMPSEVLKHLQLFLDDRKLRPLVTALSTATAGVQFNSLLTAFDQERQSARVATVITNDNIFTVDGITFKNTVRTPTGVACVDSVLGGGTAVGEVYGLLGPTGGGKTTMATSIFCEIARTKRHVAYFSYETELVPQVSNKIYGYMANIPRNSMKNITSVDDLPETYRDKLKSELTAYGQYMKPCDMKHDIIHGTGGGGVPEIRAHLRRYHDAGEHIDVIIVDQLLSMVDSYLVVNRIDMSLRREYLQLTVDQFREMVQTSDMACAAIILHQVDNSVKQAGPMRAPKKGDAAEDKSFDNNLHFCMQLGMRDAKNRLYFGTPKAREDEEKLLIIELDNTYWRFNWTSGKFIKTQGGFILSNASDEHTVPDMHTLDTDSKADKSALLDEAEIT